MSASLFRALARALIKHAQRSMPSARNEWAQAMLAELEHIEDSRRALSWSVGCLIAVYSERFNVMRQSTFRISSWMLVLEAIVCFGPLSLLWLKVLANWHRVVFDAPIVVGFAFCTLAPVCAALAFLCIAWRRALNNRLFLALAGAFAAFGVLQLASMYPKRAPIWFNSDFGLILLCSVLPMLCCLHLSWIVKSERSQGRA